MSHIFIDPEDLNKIRYKYPDRESEDVADLVSWLSEAPKYTTFRINKLKSDFHVQKLKENLSQQNIYFGVTNLPKIYTLRPDCLILGRWPKKTYNSLKSTGKQIIVDVACGVSVLRGSHVYAPGVMGMPSNVQLEEIVDVYADVEGKCKRGLKINYEGTKQFVGVGVVKQIRNHLFNNVVRPSGVAIHMLMPQSSLPVINESIFPRGSVLLQNLPSIVCGWVVNAQPLEFILDMCAAPGNKTSHLAEMSNNEAQIIAIDKTKSKVAKIEEKCLLHGITCVRTYAFDSTKSYSELSCGYDDGPPFPENCFDKILLDAPCSGLGQRPQLKKFKPDIDSYKFVQRKLLYTAVKLLKIGGKLIYSTCTVTQDENEGMVSWALDHLECLKLVAAEPLLGGPGWVGVGLTDEQRGLVQRFGPELDDLRHTDQIYKDTIGFFIATFVKCK